MLIPGDLRYSTDHEWVRVDGNRVTVGITDYAQDALGDVVFVDLPKKGASFDAHAVFGTIEAVKAVSELFSPLAGEVVEVNARLDGEPALVNTDPYGDGWMVKLRVKGAREGLMDAGAYAKLIGH